MCLSLSQLKGGTSGLKIGVAPRVNRRNFCVRYILSRRWSFRRVAEIARLPLVESGLVGGGGGGGGGGLGSYGCSTASSQDELLVLVEWSLAQVLQPFLSMLRGPMQVSSRECASS